MNRTIFVILVLLGFFALTKSKPSKPWPPICKNDYVCDSMGPGYECVDGRCEALPTISKGEYKTKHSRLFRNPKLNIKKIPKLKIQTFNAFNTDLNKCKISFA